MFQVQYKFSSFNSICAVPSFTTEIIQLIPRFVKTSKKKKKTFIINERSMEVLKAQTCSILLKHSTYINSSIQNVFFELQSCNNPLSGGTVQRMNFWHNAFVWIFLYVNREGLHVYWLHNRHWNTGYNFTWTSMVNALYLFIFIWTDRYKLKLTAFHWIQNLP